MQKRLKEQNRCADIRYLGRVQGVGFRYTVLSISSSFDVSGFVRNEMDGSVRLLVEGAEQELMDFINQIRSSSVGRHIKDEQICWRTPQGRYSRFSIET